MKIYIGADFVPTASNEDLFVKADTEKLFGQELFALLKNNFCIFNLEVPLTNAESPIKKCGPTLVAKRETVNTYKALDVNILSIANNHIMDQGEQGLRSTTEVLNENNIAFLGAGKNLDEASKPYIFELNDKKIGVYACAEHEFSVAEKEKCGANPFNALESLDHITNLKKECNYVIVLYHGGKEHYRYPSPNLKKICEKIAEKGADLIVCQHSHCVGCEEDYNGSKIIYGQGNFLFDHNTSEFWKTSLLIEIDEEFNISYIPLVKADNAVRLANEADSRNIITAFASRSEEIKNDSFVNDKYSEFASSALNSYLFNLSGIKRTFSFKVLNKVTKGRYSKWIINKKYKEKKLLMLQNYIECEAHRELLLKGVKNK